MDNLRRNEFDCETDRLESYDYKELDLDNFRLESDIYNTQPGGKPSADLMNNGCYDEYCGGRVIDSLRFESDLPTGGQVGMYGFCSGQVLDSYRFESDLPTGCQNSIKMAEYGNLSSRNDEVSGVELPLYYTDHHMENQLAIFTWNK